MLAGLLAVALAGCGSTPPRPAKPDVDLHAPSATRRLEAVAVTEKQHDPSQVPALIDRLDDDDPAVRMMAGSSLTAITGHDTGYRPYASPAERLRQVALWRAWWGTQTGGQPPSSSGCPLPKRPSSPAASAPGTGGAGYTQGSTHVGSP